MDCEWVDDELIWGVVEGMLVCVLGECLESEWLYGEVIWEFIEGFFVGGDGFWIWFLCDVEVILLCERDLVLLCDGEIFLLGEVYGRLLCDGDVVFELVILIIKLFCNLDKLGDIIGNVGKFLLCIEFLKYG